MLSKSGAPTDEDVTMQAVYTVSTILDNSSYIHVHILIILYMYMLCIISQLSFLCCCTCQEFNNKYAEKFRIMRFSSKVHFTRTCTLYIHSYHFVCNYCFMSLILLFCIFIHSSVLRRSTHLIYQTYLASRSTLRCVTLPIILPRPLMPLGGALVEYSVPTPPGERGVRRAANRGASGAICPKPQLLRVPQAVSNCKYNFVVNFDNFYHFKYLPHACFYDMGLGLAYRVPLEI